MKFRFLATFFVIIAVSATALGQVKLERRYEEGSSFKVETTLRSRQKMTLAGMNRDSTSDSTTVTTLKVGQRDGSGNVPQTEDVESLRINVNSYLGDYFFDSQNPDNNQGTSLLEPLRAIHKLITEIPTTVVFDKDNEVVEVKVDQNIFGSLPVELQDVLRAEYNATKLKEAVARQMDQLPKDPVSPGDTWQRTEKLNLEGGQTMSFETKFTYDGTIEKDGRTLDKISSEAQNVKYTLEPNDQQLTLKSSDLKIAKSSGTILFDRELGRTIEDTSLVQITGEMMFVYKNDELPAVLDLTIESEVKMQR